MPDLPIPQKYIDAIKGFEGFTPRASWDVNNWRNGYGTNASAQGEMIDEATANSRLQNELHKAAGYVDSAFSNLPEGVRAALTSLTYNAGPGWIKSGLGNAVRSGDMGQAAALLQQYNKSAGSVLPGLTNRRQAEASWFNGPPGQPYDRPPGQAPIAGGLLGQPSGVQTQQQPPSGGLLAALPQQQDAKANPGMNMAMLGLNMLNARPQPDATAPISAPPQPRPQMSGMQARIASMPIRPYAWS